LLEKGDLADFEWDVISGVSAGAITGTIIGLTPRGKLAEAALTLAHLWI